MAHGLDRPGSRPCKRLRARPRRRAIHAAGLVAGLMGSTAAAAELPDAGSARYELVEGGEPAGHVIMEWAFEADDTYRLERRRNLIQRPVREDYEGDRRLRQTREVSEGTLDDGLPRPERYEVSTGTVFQDPGADPEPALEALDPEPELTARFTGDEAAAEAGETALPAQALDPLAHRWHLMQEALEAEGRARLTHTVADREGEVREIAFRIEGHQTVRAESGTFRTVRIVRHDPGAQRAERWYLAQGWGGLPVRTVDSGSERHAERTRLRRLEQAPDD